jgi:hypothetical protein
MMRVWSTVFISVFPLILMVNSNYFSAQNLLNNFCDREDKNLLCFLSAFVTDFQLNTQLE